MLFGPTVLHKQSFGILLCSGEFLLRSVALDKYGPLAFELDDGGGEGRSSCSNKRRLLNSMIIAVITLEAVVKPQKPSIRDTTTLTIKEQIKIAPTHLTVTTCLYRRPSDRASSLSTLITVTVIKDTPLKTILTKSAQVTRDTHKFRSPFIWKSNSAANIG